MVSRQKMVERVTTLMDRPENIRNIGIVAHIDHGKTTLSDNLLAGAGMISKELAGTQLFMDFDEEEQARGITINAANVSMVHEFLGNEVLNQPHRYAWARRLRGRRHAGHASG